jgi:hypothetical protein
MIDHLPAAIALAYLAGSISGGASKAGSPLIGLAIGTLIGLPWEWLPVAAFAGWVAEKPSPAKWSHGRIIDGVAGKDTDVMPDRGSSSIEITKPGFEYFNLAVRGLINAIAYFPFYFVVGWPALFPLAYIAGWTLGDYIAVFRKSPDDWHESEGIRQLVTGVLISAGILI